jgi:RimJ/RimL family protein N-acetyltransferase
VKTPGQHAVPSTRISDRHLRILDPTTQNQNRNYEHQIVLNDGTRGIIRPIVLSDRTALAAALEELAPESRMRRFFYDKSKLTETELDRLTSPDGINHIAYGMAVSLDDETEHMPIAVARCFRDKDQNDLAEVAVVIADQWQGMGAGFELLSALSAAARDAGIRRWFASIFNHNTAMKRLLDHFGTMCENRDLGGGVIEVIYDITQPPEIVR